MQVIESALVNFLRAEQKTSVLMAYQIAKKYLSLTLILIAVLVISRSLYTGCPLADGLRPVTVMNSRIHGARTLLITGLVASPQITLWR